MITNIKFSVTVPTYSATHKRMVVGATAAIENVQGRLYEMMPSLESEIVQANERDRMVRHRLVFQRTRAMENYIKSGAIITVTHRLHTQANSWRAMASPLEQYIVQSDSDVQITGNDVNLGLVRKDQA